MVDKQAKQFRINELKSKINYTEEARDNFKNTHPGLYETNSYYLNKLREELRELEKSYLGIVERNQRKFSRVEVERAAHLNFSSGQYRGTLENISLGGGFIKGAFKQAKGDICKINLTESKAHSDVVICALGSIVRASNNGIAFEFIAMNANSYARLETELLDHADDPSIVGDEIFESGIFEFDDDLVYSTVFNYNINKLKKLLCLH
ncbi:MAG: PilZ domain-containing protein [Candidatus Electrothrix scaldis]|nr:PilZ domain-containing protein [Candidatus Electrothrix aestuarii]WPD23399.1 MAG: PilZ domain-containing protein [Candidatus Electrothrix sp. GW3-3]